MDRKIINPFMINRFNRRTMRGGSVFLYSIIYSSTRDYFNAFLRRKYIGFRIVLINTNVVGNYCVTFK